MARNKYRNKPTFVRDQRFDSKKEAKRFVDLEIMQRIGEIRELKTQVPFEMEYNGEVFLKYVADFTYWQGEEFIVEDVKSPVTKQNPVYRIKKKAMKLWHGIDILET